MTGIHDAQHLKFPCAIDLQGKPLASHRQNRCLPFFRRFAITVDEFGTSVETSSLQTVFAASEQWHNRLIRKYNDVEKLSWLPVFASPTPVGILLAQELSNTTMLREEGTAMRHCVASRARECHKGNNHIFSLQTANGQRKSTLHIERRSENFIVVEHKAFANQEPDADSLDAEWQLLETLNMANSIPHQIKCEVSTTEAG